MTTHGPTGELSYNGYLRVPELLGLQSRLSQHHDEMQFIVIHQVYELWFRLVLWELEDARAALFSADAERATHRLERVNEIFRILVAQFEVIETMRPYEFLQFRDQLKPASGFQSVQFRELEYLAGAKDPRFLTLFAQEPAVERLRARLAEPSLWDAFLALVKQRGLTVEPEAELKRSLARIERRECGAELYRLVDGFVTFDQRAAHWRSRHLLMTERIIGGRPGTGEKLFQKLTETGYSAMGAGGVHYLETTLKKKMFPLLWEVRSELTT